MKYTLLKYLRWLRQFGLRGLKLIIRRGSPGSELISLNSRRYGRVWCRNCFEDLEVLNTVFLFRAYHILKHYRKCRAVLDLGANIGIASRFFAQELPDVHIVAVEPSSDNCGIYEKNLAIELQAGRVRLLRCAVGAKDGDGCIDVGKNVRFDSFKIVKAEKIYHSGSESCLPVKILGMKHLVRLLDGPLLVKIDIEGSEQELLEVRDEWIAFANCLMIEFHNRLQEDVWIRTLTNEGWDAAKFFDTWHFARVQQN